MDRLQRKCLIASALTHGFLFLLFFVGSAFFVSQPKKVDYPVVRVVPTRMIDEAFAGGGGNPKLAPSDAKQKGETLTPQPPQPTPPQPAPPQPQHRVQQPQQPPPQPKKVETAAQNKKPAAKPTSEPPKEALKLTPVTPKTSNQKPALDLKPWVRNDAEKAKAQAEAEAQRLADARRRIERSVGSASKKLEGFLNGTAVEVPGPGGEAYANYAAFVREAYDNAWIVAQALTDDDATAVVKVVIRRDGRVIDARIIRRSGNSALDKSVQSALDRVKEVRPFPDGARDAQREFTIDFNLKAKRAMG